MTPASWHWPSVLPGRRTPCDHIAVECGRQRHGRPHDLVCAAAQAKQQTSVLSGRLTAAGDVAGKARGEARGAMGFVCAFWDGECVCWLGINFRRRQVAIKRDFLSDYSEAMKVSNHESNYFSSHLDNPLHYFIDCNLCVWTVFGLHGHQIPIHLLK